MKDHHVDYIDFPITTDTRNYLLDFEDHPDYPDIQNRGDVMRIEFDEVEKSQCAGKTRGRMCSLEELKISFFVWFKINDPQQLECKLKKWLTSEAHRILWTPPCCPELHPIEIFWAAGENHVARNFVANQSMENHLLHALYFLLFSD